MRRKFWATTTKIPQSKLDAIQYSNYIGKSKIMRILCLYWKEFK
ncbi:MAG: hypothetical protein ABIC04_02960 [Nanoarchaeota archaeon]